ncbi:MAG: hypothetical protein LAN84_09275, partial [Acidobacteriia bacterium]|nr:hypothetical protein [Terriglobia bacterium]
MRHAPEGVARCAGTLEKDGNSEEAPEKAPGTGEGQSMKLGELLQGVERVPAAGAAPVVADVEVRQVVCHSAKVQPGALFFALHGARADG